MESEAGQDKSSSITAEIIILVLVNLSCFLIFFQFDVLEWLYKVSSEHEEYELDEIIPLFITISISLSVFSYRRVSEQKQLIDELSRYATQDYLTGLFNRRHAMSAMSSEVRRSSRRGDTFSVMLMDIDNFKVVNDTHGHGTGDLVLMQLATVLLGALRSSDLVSRWGGEEFLILCPDTDSSGAVVLAEEILNAIRTEQFLTVNHITVSMGVATCKKGEELGDLIKRVDDCLYSAKAKGKDGYISD
jgi:diguanylate cyclase (GGDEF)-like protein